MSDLPDPLPDHAGGYAALRSFAAPAQGKTELWRILAVLVLWVLLSDFARATITAAIRSALGPLFGTVALVNLTLGLTPSGVVGNLALGLPLGLVFVLAVGLVTGRGLATLLGRRERLWPDLWRSFLPVALPGFLPILLGDAMVTPLQPPLTVALWLPLALPALILAAGASEIVFRGFLQQQLAARWAPSWVWMGLPAGVFALAQGAPAAAGALAPLAVVWSLCFAAAAADLTARTGSLGAAIGLQAGIQAQGLFCVALKGPMTGLALATLDLRGDALAPWMAVDFLTLLVGWLAARLLLRV